MTDHDLAAIAAKLSKAQRAAIVRAVTTRGIAHRLLRRGFVRTTEAADGVGTLISLSADGLALRAHILSQEQNPS